ncbi:MAG TPA: glycosyltransferase [Tenuifilaceae bacterium]|nr:glycosyltransferase [Tenuifilaceae bacterium]
MTQISAVIIAYNEEDYIERCIKSVQGVADEVLVVDSFSTDKTGDICRQLGVRFIRHPFEGYREQKNYALQLATYDYILSLDADEALSEELRQSILNVKENWGADGYYFNRLNNYCGQWIHHTNWYPDRKLRLFDRKKGSWGGVNPHDRVVMQKGSKVHYLKGDMLHWVHSSYEAHIEKANKFSTIAAHEYFKLGKKSSIFGIFYHSSWCFFKAYVIRLGFLDGYNGFVVSSLTAYTRFLKYVKLRHLNLQHKSESLSVEKIAKKEFVPLTSQPASGKPIATIIITTYNQPEWLKKVLWGFSKQTFSGFEILIADDGSDEKTKAVIEEFSRTGKFRLKHVWHPDMGFRKCTIINKAITQASSDYLIFTDGDCIPRNDFVETHVKYARRGYFLSGGYFKLTQPVSVTITHDDITMQKPFKASWLLHQGQPFTYKLLKFTRSRFLQHLLNTITTARATWNGHNVSGWKADIVAVNGYNENMQYGGLDRELGERLVNYGLKGKQIRYSAACIHLDHPRPYKTQLTLDQNKQIRKDVRRNKITWTSNGIIK